MTDDLDGQGERPRLRRGEACYHTEHAVGGLGYVGRFFTSDGRSHWEQCPNQPSYGAVARAEALLAKDPEWMHRTQWHPVNDARTETAR